MIKHQIKTRKISVRQKVDQRAGQLSLQHVMNNGNQKEIELKPMSK